MDFQHTLKTVLACRLQRAAVWSSSFSFEPKHQVSFACYCQLMLPCVIWHPITTARPDVVHICCDDCSASCCADSHDILRAITLLCLIAVSNVGITSDVVSALRHTQKLLQNACKQFKCTQTTIQTACEAGKSPARFPGSHMGQNGSLPSA